VRVWDVSTGHLKVALTGHTETVRGLAVSERSPFLFSAGEDKRLLCWDLQQNAVVRDFFGHLSAVNAVACHPKLDVIVSCGRDATVRLWDIRLRKEAMIFSGHTEAVLSLLCQSSEPQIISGGSDGLIYFWDVIAGRPLTRCTRHRMPVRALSTHPVENVLLSAGADHIRMWRLPTGEFINNLSPPHRSITVPPQHGGMAGLWSTSAMSPRDVLFVGGDGGEMRFYDYATKQAFFQSWTRSLPGTLPGEGGILCSAFDHSGQKLFTGEGDKTVKMWSEVATDVSSK
jgi:pleiotropic regulator 1